MICQRWVVTCTIDRNRKSELKEEMLLSISTVNLPTEKPTRKISKKIVALIYDFDGTGSIHYAKLEDGDEQVVFEDNFE